MRKRNFTDLWFFGVLIILIMAAPCRRCHRIRTLPPPLRQEQYRYPMLLHIVVNFWRMALIHRSSFRASKACASLQAVPSRPEMFFAYSWSFQTKHRSVTRKISTR